MCVLRSMKVILPVGKLPVETVRWITNPSNWPTAEGPRAFRGSEGSRAAVLRSAANVVTQPLLKQELITIMLVVYAVHCWILAYKVLIYFNVCYYSQLSYYFLFWKRCKTNTSQLAVRHPWAWVFAGPVQRSAAQRNLVEQKEITTALLSCFLWSCISNERKKCVSFYQTGSPVFCKGQLSSSGILLYVNITTVWKYTVTNKSPAFSKIYLKFQKWKFSKVVYYGEFVIIKLLWK